MTDHSDLADFYRRYGHDSFAGDEPAYAAICDSIAGDPAMLELLAAHPRERQQPNLILAAVHYLLLGGLEHPLHQIYYGSSTADPGEAFIDLVLSHRSAVDELLATRHTQTNEVGRSSVLSLGLAHIADRGGEPLAWVDLGTSAGLNLGIDRFRVDYRVGSGMVSTGPNDAALVIDAAFSGVYPTIRSEVPEVAWRVGVDRQPIDVTDPNESRWLKACLWPSQPERMARVDAAIAVALDRPPQIIGADAVAGLAEAIRSAPVDANLVVTTTWVWYYLPRPVQQHTVAVMAGAGRPVQWLSLEGAGVVAELKEERNRHSVDSTIGLVEFADGGVVRAEVLGHAHPHGAWIDWLAAD